MLKLGILGAGHLASYCVAGLRRAGDLRDIIVSPRNSQVAKQLKDTHCCQIAQTNQQLIDDVDIVLLAVRPHQLADLIPSLRFKPNQRVVSAMAGVTLNDLRAYQALADTQLIRVMPNVCAEAGAGAVPIYPGADEIESLFAALGKVVVLTSEADFEVANAHACLNGWVYFWLQEMIDWSRHKGIDEATARLLVLNSVKGAITYAEYAQPEHIVDIGQSVATPGTYTLAGLTYLNQNRGLKLWSEALEQTSKVPKS